MNGLEVIEKVELKAPKIYSIFSDTEVISKNKKFHLGWDIEDANKIILNQDLGDVTGTKSISLYGDHKYKSITLTAIGDINEIIYNIEFLYIEISNIENVNLPVLLPFEINSINYNTVDIFNVSLVENTLPRNSWLFNDIFNNSGFSELKVQSLPSPNIDLIKEKVNTQSVFSKIKNSIKKFNRKLKNEKN